MTRFLTGLALLILPIFIIAEHRRDCRHVGGGCVSSHDCYSGYCDRGKCQTLQYSYGDKSLTIIDDMVFTEDQLRSGIRNESFRWPNRTMPYELDPNFSTRDLRIINAGLDQLRNRTCLRFVPRTNEMDWVYFNLGGKGCYSYVGRQGTGKQILNLDWLGCMNEKTVIHETIHALGFHHEQCRPDRDDYVTINWLNIPCQAEHNFWKLEADTFGVDYDYHSIMHYGAYDFAIFNYDRKIQTIIPKKPGVKELGGDVLTESDILKINRMYGC